MAANELRMTELASRAGAPRFSPGEYVRRVDYPDVGVVDTVYADYTSVTDNRAVQDDWYEEQEIPLRTSKDGRFYSVILSDGAIVAGEDDLVSVVTH